MEHIPFTCNEFRYLRKHKINLETRFHLKIIMPEVFNPYFTTFATVYGDKHETQNLRDLLKQKTANPISVITLSDTECEFLSHTQKVKKIPKKRKNSPDSSTPVVVVEDLTVDNNPDCKRVRLGSPAKDFLSLNVASNVTVVSQTQSVPSNPLRHVNHLLSSAADKIVTASTSQEADDSIIIIEESSSSEEGDGSIMLLEDRPVVEVPMPVGVHLRPIVIDGSNIAREHGKAENTFSCRGIKISVDFFLKRGHTEVFVLIPKFRKHRTNGQCPTTDAHILDDLERAKHVYFTPSRYMNGRLITCYDDRFIVKLAAGNGGVILSNDNYKDLMDESESFKRTIQERLLMFSFVGDLLMIPEDPLGRYGPLLGEFLTFPGNENPLTTIRKI